MMTRCKAGDLAIVLRAKQPRRVGQIVKVLAMNADSWADGVMWWNIQPLSGEPPPEGKTGWRSRDRDLTPIRGSTGSDETLSWKPVPTKEST